MHSKATNFRAPNAFHLHKPLFVALKSCLFAYKKPLIRTNLSLLLTQATLFRPPSPIFTQP